MNKTRSTGLMLPMEDYVTVYGVTRNSLNRWIRQGYDLDDPPQVWKWVFSHQTWPATFPTAPGDCGDTWNRRWLEAAEKRGVLE